MDVKKNELSNDQIMGKYKGSEDISVIIRQLYSQIDRQNDIQIQRKIDRQRERKVDIQIAREKERQIDREIDIEKERQIDRQKDRLIEYLITTN